MASSLLKTHILPSAFNPKFENVTLELHPQMLYVKSIDKELIIRVTDGQKDDG